MNFTNCFNRSMEFVRKLLFKPFSLPLWLTLALPAWLSAIGDGGGVNLFLRLFGQNLKGILNTVSPVFIAASVLILLVISLLLFWVRCRAKFCFLHALESGRDGCSFGESWRNFRKAGDDYFVVSLIYGVAVCVLTLVIIGIGFFLGILASKSFVSVWAAGVFIFAEGLLFLLYLFEIVIFSVAFMELVPVWMYDNRELTARDALDQLWELFKNRRGLLIKFAFSLLLVGTCVSFVLVGVGMVTCCIGFLLMAIPYIGTAVILPLVCFMRKFCMECAREIWASRS